MTRFTDAILEAAEQNEVDVAVVNAVGHDVRVAAELGDTPSHARNLSAAARLDMLCGILGSPIEVHLRRALDCFESDDAMDALVELSAAAILRREQLPHV